jgi:ABC-type bacteriocin/lantibiotic exporter with double-glycine peptidase domain
VHLQVNDLLFEYPDKGFGLNVKNLTVNYGESVAIIGPSGSGKSTLFDLLLGVIHPLSGEIIISSKDTYADSIDARNGIAFVSQKIPIFNSTIRFNIALKDELTESEVSNVWDCLKSAGLYEFVQNLPSQIDTQLGESGSRISGGQIQRIGLARALFRNPHILFLDEATSALDPETENFITEILDSFSGSMTIISIVHRMHILKRADLIVYMENGGIVSSGNFQHILANVPSFAAQFEVWNS